MNFQDEILIMASPTTIFPRYADVSGWSEWDADVRGASLAGEFKAGTEGVLFPAKGPKTKIQLSEVTLNRSFTSQTKLPLCTMQFEHLLIPLGESTRVIHHVSFSGPLRFLWRRIIGTQIERGLPHALRGLKDACEFKSGE